MLKGVELVEVVKEISKYQTGKPSVEGSFVFGIPYQPLVAVGVWHLALSGSSSILFKFLGALALAPRAGVYL